MGCKEGGGLVFLKAGNGVWEFEEMLSWRIFFFYIIKVGMKLRYLESLVRWSACGPEHLESPPFGQ